MIDEGKPANNSSLNCLIEVLEKNLNIIHNSNDPKLRWESQKILNKFQNKNDLWKFVFNISEFQNIKVAYFFLILLDRKVSFFWHELNIDLKEQILNLVTEKIFKLSLLTEKNKEESVILTKLNVILIKIICQRGKNFFFPYLNDLINSSQKSESVCENNFNLILIFFEEVFFNLNFEIIKNVYLNDFRFEQILEKIRKMIFSVFYRSYISCHSNSNLISLSLKTLKKSLELSSGNFYIEKIFLETLIVLCAKTKIRLYSVECLLELCKNPNNYTLIASTEIIENFIFQFNENFFVGNNWIDSLSSSNQEVLEFLKSATLFFSLFINNYWIHQKSFLYSSSFLCSKKKKGIFLLLLQFMIKMLCLPDFEIFKICLEWWISFVKQVFFNKIILLSIFDYFYFFLLTDLKIILVGRMPKPEEILIRLDDSGEIIRESTLETNVTDVYFQGKNLLIMLTSIDFNSTKFIIYEKLNFQFYNNFFDKNAINTVCWSVGSISHDYIMSLDCILPKYVMSLDEEEFLTTVIKSLLCLCDSKIEKNDKSIIASNIMYIVGEFHIFVEKHWSFLRVVLSKLFDFIYENHPGIKDMACDTFLKISKSCSKQIVKKMQIIKNLSLLDDIFDRIEFDFLVCVLEFHQKKEFFTGLAILINSTLEDNKIKFYTKEMYTILFDFSWHFYFKKNLFCGNQETMRDLIRFININCLTAKILNKKYCPWIQVIFNEIRFVYSWLCKETRNLFLYDQKNFLNSKNFRLLKNLRNEIMVFFEIFMENCIFDTKNIFINQNLNFLCQSIFFDYYKEIHQNLRDPRIIIFCIKLIKKGKNFLEANLIFLIFHTIFKPTLNMLKNNFEDFPDLRIAFFLLLDSLIHECFDFIYKLNENVDIQEISFELLIYALIWGLKHTEIIISRQATRTFLVFLSLLEKKKLEKYVYLKFFKQILTDIIVIITDKLHFSNLKIYCQLLSILIKNSKIYVDQIYLEFHLNLIFGKIFTFLDKKYLENFIILFLTENNSDILFEEFSKVLGLSKNYSEENFSSEN